jgi:hypothetical protein
LEWVVGFYYSYFLRSISVHRNFFILFFALKIVLRIVRRKLKTFENYTVPTDEYLRVHFVTNKRVAYAQYPQSEPIVRAERIINGLTCKRLFKGVVRGNDGRGRMEIVDEEMTGTGRMETVARGNDGRGRMETVGAQDLYEIGLYGNNIMRVNLPFI